MNPEDHYSAKRNRKFYGNTPQKYEDAMNVEDFYKRKRKRIFWEFIYSCLGVGIDETLIQKAANLEHYCQAKTRRIFWQKMTLGVAILFIVAIGSMSGYLLHKFW